MPDLTFNTPAGEAVKRHLMILYLNTGTEAAPVWSAIGKRAEDSSMEMDWQKESKKDVLGNTFNSAKDPIITQTFDPCPLDGGDPAQVKLWNLAIKDHDYSALMSLDMMVAHFYAGPANGTFAERYSECAVMPSSLGGEGGAFLSMPIEVTLGGTRTMGTVTKDNGGIVTFTADAA